MPKQPFHLVTSSPLPLLTSSSITLLVFGFLIVIVRHDLTILILALLFLFIVLAQWFYAIVVEATFQGKHTLKVQSGLKLGMAFFIASEVIFFFGFFFTYCFFSLSPPVEFGSTWPPTGVRPLNPFHLPLLNTVILLTSGITITCAQSSILWNLNSSISGSIVNTLLCAFFFIVIQCFEYWICPFTISDRVFGSVFYVATGFHGLHVLIGAFFLWVCLVRSVACHFRPTRHLGFTFACWYWHFVDVVWVLLWVLFYCWGS